MFKPLSKPRGTRLWGLFVYEFVIKPTFVMLILDELHEYSSVVPALGWWASFWVTFLIALLFHVSYVHVIAMDQEEGSSSKEEQ